MNKMFFSETNAQRSPGFHKMTPGSRNAHFEPRPQFHEKASGERERERERRNTEIGGGKEEQNERNFGGPAEGGPAEGGPAEGGRRIEEKRKKKKETKKMRKKRGKKEKKKKEETQKNILE